MPDNNNRAFIKRDEKTTKYLLSLVAENKITLNPENYFDENYWFFESGESFHVLATNRKVLFQDQRLPRFALDLKYVELEWPNGKA